MRKHALALILIFLFSLWSLRSIFHPGFMYSHDSLWHVERLQNIFSLIPTQFPVRWSPTLDNGYGIPLFNFTYPAPYYLGAIFMFIGLGPVKAYYALLFLAYFIGGLGIYILGCRRRPIIGFFAALLYLLTPYQFLDIFVRGALGEVMALGLIPWVILCYQNISQSGSFKWYSALPLALLILSHNFYAYLFVGLLTLFILAFYHHKMKLFGSMIFSLALSAFFLLPAFFEKSSLLITQTTSHQFEAHFVYPSQLIYSVWVYLGSVIGNSPNEMSFQLGLANIIIGLGALCFLGYQLFRSHLPFKLFCYVLTLAFSIFMTLPQSIWFWNNLPLISSLQFPWRFLGPATILFSLVYIELGRLISTKQVKIFLVFSVLLLGIALYNTRNYYRPVKWMTEAEFLALHYEYVGKNTTANRNELIPRWAPVERYNANFPPSVTAGQITNYVVTPLSISFIIETSDQQNIVIERNYFPTWVGEIDSQALTVSPSSTGAISLPITPGTHTYRLYYQSTLIEKLGNVLSLISLVLVGYFLTAKSHGSIV